MQQQSNPNSNQNHNVDFDNRFSLKFLYDGKPIVQRDGGYVRAMERNFSATYNDIREYYLGHGDKTYLNNNTKLLFEYSQEQEKMAEEIKCLFEYILWEGTSDFLADKGADYTHKSTTKGKKFTILLIDNFAFDESKYKDVPVFDDLSNKIDKMNQMILDIKSDTTKEKKDLEALKKQYNYFFIKKTLMKLDIDADKYTFDGTDFVPPIHKIWKDFNVLYENIDNKSKLEDFDVERLREIRYAIRECNNVIESIQKSIDAMNESSGSDNIIISNLERQIRQEEKKKSDLLKITFRGLRSVVKYYLSQELTPKSSQCVTV